MDARVDGVPVTPRAGKPVEVNALWVNGLAGARRPARARRARDAATLAARHGRGDRRRSGARFPAPAGWLLRRRSTAPAGDDAALRPNQLLAWSLPYAPLEPDPAALRRIAGGAAHPARACAPSPPDDPAYRGRTGADRPSATAPTTRARSGRGCSGR